jgi:hypothetical protein
MADTVSLEDQIAVVRRLIAHCEGRALYLQGHHGRASIPVEQEDWDGLSSILATLIEVRAAGLTEYQKRWPRLLRGISFSLLIV